MSVWFDGDNCIEQDKNEMAPPRSGSPPACLPEFGPSLKAGPCRFPPSLDALRESLAPLRRRANLPPPSPTLECPQSMFRRTWPMSQHHGGASIFPPPRSFPTHPFRSLAAPQEPPRPNGPKTTTSSDAIQPSPLPQPQPTAHNVALLTIWFLRITCICHPATLRTADPLPCRIPRASFVYSYLFTCFKLLFFYYLLFLINLLFFIWVSIFFLIKLRSWTPFWHFWALPLSSGFPLTSGIPSLFLTHKLCLCDFWVGKKGTVRRQVVGGMAITPPQ